MNLESRRQFMQWSLAAAAGASAKGAATSDAAPLHSALIEQTRSLLGSLQSNALHPFLADWPAGQDRRAIVPSSLPVLRWLPEVKADAPAFSASLVQELCRVAQSMAWRQTYKAADVGAVFLENYGWTEIVGLSGNIPSQRIACGFLLLGPATHYPRHRHEAEEIYVPLTGDASWQRGDGVWREQLPGTVIHHASDEPHSMRTGARPLLALYLWRSANLNQKSRLDP
jgi:Dimethlysulfonioproprionate lyase